MIQDDELILDRHPRHRRQDLRSREPVDGTTVACLPLAAITTVKQIAENAFDNKIAAAVAAAYVSPRR